jgi:hypothetical protein
MKRSRKSEPAGPQLRSWRVGVIRKKLEHLGSVRAVDRATAEDAAVTEFGLSDQDRQRLFVQEQL